MDLFGRGSLAVLLFFPYGIVFILRLKGSTFVYLFIYRFHILLIAFVDDHGEVANGHVVRIIRINVLNNSFANKKISTGYVSCVE